MFTPEMMQAAQRMMSSMTPEQIAQMASAIDPSMLPPGMPRPTPEQMREATAKMKDMSADDLKAAVGEAQRHMSSSSSAAPPSQRLKEEGNALFKNGLYQDAIGKYAAAITTATSELKLQLTGNICFCHVKLGNWKKAVKFADQILSQDPENLKALFRRGLALRQLRRKSAALADLNKAASIAPDDVAVAQELATAQALPDLEEVDDVEDVEIEDEDDEVQEITNNQPPSTTVPAEFPGAGAMPDVRTMASMASMVESLPEEFFDSLIAGQTASGGAAAAGALPAGLMSGKRLKCLARLVMKSLKVWVAVTDVAKVMLQRRVVVATTVSVVIVAVALKFYPL